MRLRWGFLFLFCLSPVSAVLAQQQPSVPQHAIEDWSTRHVIFTGLTPQNISGSAKADPRAWHVWSQYSQHKRADRWSARDSNSPGKDERRHKFRRERMKIDWQMPIVIGADASPAKFSFDVNATPDCTNDFVVFPTTNSYTPGVTGRASLIAFNDLYTGPGPSGICPTPSSPASQPSVLFAYNTTTTTSGEAHSSPVLSLDGRKIAFMESNDGYHNDYAAFHVLTWKAGEGTSATSAVPPGDCPAGGSCLATVVLTGSTSDSESSPFVDYANDVAYVGDDHEQLHKITGTFSGSPSEVTGNGWPIQLETIGNGHVHSPVYDSASGRIFVTNNLGTLFVIDATTATILARIALGAVVISDPVVDSTNQTVFLFMVDSSGFLAVAEYDTSGTLLRKVTEGSIGCDASVRSGTFDHNYFVNPSSGLLYFSGSVACVPSLYSVGFTGTTMNASASGPLLLATGSPPHHAGTLTEIFNPNFTGSPDRLFVSIGSGCASGSSDGCIESFDITSGFPSSTLNLYTPLFSGPGDYIIVDNVSPLPQASSIYFETGQNAVKVTQSTLQ
jgi:hypothetical protein